MRSRLDLDKYSEISARSRRIWKNIGQISIDPTRCISLRQDLSQNLARFQPLIANLKPTDMHPKPTRPNSANLKLHTGWFWVLISPTRVCRVESRLGTNSTRADPWTPLTVVHRLIDSKIKIIKYYYLDK